MAAAVAVHPDRFRAFATLPMSDPKAAAGELQRAVDELGFVGTMIHGQTRGMFLDHPSMSPVLACAARLDVPIYLHPAPPPPAVYDAYYKDLQPDVSAVLSTSGWGWHAECGMHVLRMVVNGVFDRFPALRVIVGHMGEMLPFSLARADDMISPVLSRGSLSVAETVQRNVYLTTSAYTTAAPLQCALTVFGADRILFAVDLSPSDREKIAHGNAERLLRLPPA